jgi:hypothetical protein
MEEINAALASAKIAVLLVTKDFLASEFIHEHELGPLLKQAALAGTKIYWILLRACAWKETPLKDYQALTPPAKPLAEMKAERDRAWVHICEQLKKAMTEIDSLNTNLHSTRHHRDATLARPRLELLVRFADKEELIVSENQFAGTRGEFRPLEGFHLKFMPPKQKLRIRYMAHLAGLGDTEWAGDGQFVGGRDNSHIVEGFGRHRNSNSASHGDVDRETARQLRQCR